MRNVTLCVLVCVLTIAPGIVRAQSPKSATYITDEEIKKVNSLPGVDRQIVSVDIGKLNEAVGIIHRGPTGAPTGGAGARGAGRGAAAPTEPCGEQTTAPPANSANGIAHDAQTETT